MRLVTIAMVWALALAVQAAESPAWATKDLRAGIIGTDTSHVPAFTNAFHKHPEWRIKVVAAFKGGCPDQPINANRVEKFARQIHEQYGVEIVDSIDALLGKVDVVLLESVDGRPHLAQATAVMKAGKRVFIDKPLAASLPDVRAIVKMGAETGTPWFTSSSLRYHPDIAKMRALPGITKVQGSSKLSKLAFHPDLYFYGIHGIEPMYAVLGTGCVSVSRKMVDGADVTTGTWKDGRVGLYYAIPKGGKAPVVKVWSKEGEAESKGHGGYDGLLRVIAEFFHTGKAPVAPAETVEIFEYMTAAQLSKDRGGVEVKLDEVRK